MATVVNFKGKNYIEPGAYAMNTYNPTSVVNVAEFGNVLVIDLGYDDYFLPTPGDPGVPALYSNFFRFGNPFHVSDGGEIHQNTRSKSIPQKALPFNVVLEFSNGNGGLGFTETRNIAYIPNDGDFIYEFKNYEDFAQFIGGGRVSSVVKNIFSPREGASGAPKVLYSRLFSATKQASIPIGTISSGDNGDSVVPVFYILPKKAGYCGNALYFIDGDNGYQNDLIKIIQGYVAIFEIDPNGRDVHFRIYEGDFDWKDYLNSTETTAIDIVNEMCNQAFMQERSRNIGTLVYETTIFDYSGSDMTILQFAQLLSDDPEFNKIFDIRISNSNSSAYVNQLDFYYFYASEGGATIPLTNNDDNYFTSQLSKISELDITFILPLIFSGGGDPKELLSALSGYVKSNVSKFDQFLCFSTNASDRIGIMSIEEQIGFLASEMSYLNSEKIVFAFGNPVNINDRNSTKYYLPSDFMLASIIGLNAGMAPQTPLTFKEINYKSFYPLLTKDQRIELLQAGVMHMRNVSGRWRINQGITTLQDNKKTIADDGQSFELSIALIKAQLNKELIIEGENRFIGNTAAQASPEAVKNFVETKLASFVATPGNDNLILDWKNVTVRAQNGDYFVTYDFVPNVPVNKTFFVGNILDFTF